MLYGVYLYVHIIMKKYVNFLGALRKAATTHDSFEPFCDFSPWVTFLFHGIWKILLVCILHMRRYIITRVKSEFGHILYIVEDICIYHKKRRRKSLKILQDYRRDSFKSTAARIWCSNFFKNASTHNHQIWIQSKTYGKSLRKILNLLNQKNKRNFGRRFKSSGILFHRALAVAVAVQSMPRRGAAVLDNKGYATKY